MSIEVKGLDKLKARVLELRNTSLNAAAVEGSRKIAEAIRDTAKSLCPVGTPESTGKAGYKGGSLKQSIRLQTISGQSKTLFQIGVSAGGYVKNPNTGRLVDYASYVERGTSKMAPQPFMTPAVEAHKKNLPRNIKDAIK